MKVIDAARLAELSEAARVSPRRRAHLNIHDDTAEPINRLAIALEPGTYVRPHRHRDRFEMFTIISGRAVLFTFTDDGRVVRRLVMATDQTRIAEFPAGTWHTLVALDPGTVMLELKAGPYRPNDPADVAAWAPAEGEASSGDLEAWLRHWAAAGGRWPGRP